jgi:hypothetical protein
VSDVTHTPGFVWFRRWDPSRGAARIFFGLPEEFTGERAPPKWRFAGWFDFANAADAEEFVKRWNCHERLLAALKEAEEMLLVAMHNDLGFKRKTREEIIATHPGMMKIRAAIAAASQP